MQILHGDIKQTQIKMNPKVNINQFSSLFFTYFKSTHRINNTEECLKEEQQARVLKPAYIN